ncbi:hypothetical protein [Hymenobacter guriensis]|uniref:DUF2170 family protein n=1 Tax=Hymenobacter guriensis TaxID=2793065 RepID=A0ABS0L217_9BACT|nr:hypothetical protein [Hymenobacter guriensis]MBG8554151.1 hypothetical protein [Hymenobacter guriensis]
MNTTPHILSADSEDALWQQVTADMARLESPLDYQVLLRQSNYEILLEIDVDLGGGFEGGYEFTTLSAAIPADVPLRFSLHKQDWVNEMGKLLGMEDIELGYPALDAAFIIQTNQPETLRALLADAEVQGLLLEYPDLRLSLAPSAAESPALLLTATHEEGVLEPVQLRQVYHLLMLLLQQLRSA